MDRRLFKSSAAPRHHWHDCKCVCDRHDRSVTNTPFTSKTEAPSSTARSPLAKGRSKARMAASSKAVFMFFVFGVFMPVFIAQRPGKNMPKISHENENREAGWDGLAIH